MSKPKPEPDIYGVECIVEHERTFDSTGRHLGVGHPVGNPSWFVYDALPSEPWHMHCGPYSTREQAVEWIAAIRAEPAK